MYRLNLRRVAADIALLSPSLAWADVASALKIAAAAAVYANMPWLATALIISGSAHRVRESLARLRASSGSAQQGAAARDAQAHDA